MKKMQYLNAAKDEQAAVAAAIGTTAETIERAEALGLEGSISWWSTAYTGTRPADQDDEQPRARFPEAPDGRNVATRTPRAT
jgi:hypothetical protein